MTSDNLLRFPFGNGSFESGGFFDGQKSVAGCYKSRAEHSHDGGPKRAVVFHQVDDFQRRKKSVDGISKMLPTELVHHRYS
ncbi:MAG: hypothetical protein WCS42_03000 [Verrucomicrobiota bacterium]